jgi:hypothetical protein
MYSIPNSCDTIYIVRQEVVQKMRAGPSEPAYRSRLQTTSSCCGQKAMVVSVEDKSRH